MVGKSLSHQAPVLVDQMMIISVIRLILVPMIVLTSIRKKKMLTMNQW